jgi:hypothetical protein
LSAGGRSVTIAKDVRAGRSVNQVRRPGPSKLAGLSQPAQRSDRDTNPHRNLTGRRSHAGSTRQTAQRHTDIIPLWNLGKGTETRRIRHEEKPSVTPDEHSKRRSLGGGGEPQRRGSDPIDVLVDLDPFRSSILKDPQNESKPDKLFWIFWKSMANDLEQSFLLPIRLRAC